MRTPVVAFDEDRAVAVIAEQVEAVRHRLGARWSREHLVNLLKQRLRAGDLKIAIKAVEAAAADDELADGALREVGAELQVPLLQGAALEPGHLQVIGHLQRVINRAPLRRGRGRRWYDNWYRDLTVCFMVGIVSRAFGVAPTRNREARRANGRPSAISLVVKAMARKHINLDETTVQKHLWGGMLGELARAAMEECPPELFAALHVPQQKP